MTPRFSGLRLVSAAVILSLALVLISCSTNPESSGRAPRPTRLMATNSGTDLEVLNTGYQVYQAHCVRCHSDGVPTPPPIGRMWHPEELGKQIYSSLDDAERYHVMEYLKGVDRRFHSLRVSLKASKSDRLTR